MKTLELVEMLAAGSDHRDTGHGARMAMALAGGLAGSALLLAAVYGVRSDMPELLQSPLFWLKISFPLAVLLAALAAAARLAHPGMRVGRGPLAALLLPPVALWLAGAGWLALAPSSLRLTLLLGSTWEACSLNVALLSLPTLAAMFWFLRGLAPTRLATAGAAAGLVAGAQGVLVYSLYCVEMAPPFWGVWYVLGVAAPTALGALAGPLLLRW
ncbi:DUF1109 domain-containing protein [Herbaspirillum sp. LeCh32-8]|uniref:DUF1109 domain-containing protein n=1 Tax=Herbaspirillum sp. LeCh32-8 TaxID=2821356 RepID=UPI001AEA94B1|nr:DUF1109 domain-containing protein [Herbaspirillum sp. LeCh32-8]MBP0596763.1 DUF1109 domain-containing protein [Herbaspirillum sp. LeCh32-8]